jgi:chemotaxis receptor (MCP) glutamine deamidase CheD
MTNQNPLGNFLDNLKEGAENLAEGIVGEENVKKAVDFLNQDVGVVAGDLMEQAGDVVEGLQDKAEGLIGEENIQKAQSFLNQDVGKVAGDLADKAGDTAEGLRDQAGNLIDKATGKGA